MRVARVFAVSLAFALTGLMADVSQGEASPAPRSSPIPGYWLVGLDGGVFAFNAPFEGSGAPQPGSPGLCPFAFGPTINVSAASLANAVGVISAISCVGIAAAGANAGYWVANFSSLPSGFGAASTPGQLGCSGLNGAVGGWSGIASRAAVMGFSW